MRAQLPVGIVASWSRWAIAFVAVMAVLWAGTWFAGPAARWSAITLAAVLAALIVLTWRRLPLASVTAGRVRPRRIRPALLDPTRGAVTVDHRPVWTAAPAAIRADGDDVVAVVAVDGPAHPPSVFDRARVESATFVPVSVIAAALRQFDVTLAGIDIITVGRRRAPRSHHPYSATYTAMVGDHAAMGLRRTWCVLRINRIDNAAAVVCRDSVAATLAACAGRLAAELSGRGIAARVLDATELVAVDTDLAAGVGPDPRPGWGDLRHGGGAVSAFWVSPADISTDTLDRIWVPDTDATAVAVQLRPAAAGATEIGVLVRYSTPTPLPASPLDGLNPFSARHDAAVRAGLATAAVPALRAPHRRLGPADEGLQTPLAATGILVGTLPTGHPLLLNLAAPTAGEPSTVTIDGELALLVQVALRSAAIGYQVLVVAARPQRWRDAIAAGLQVNPADTALQLPDDGPPVMLVFDTPGITAAVTGPRPAITVRAVKSQAASTADIHLAQDGPAEAVARTGGFSTRVIIDVTPERNLLKATHAA